MDFMLRCCSQQAEETENQRQARLLKDSAAEVLRLEHGKNYGPGRVKRGETRDSSETAASCLKFI